jgi:ADP-heptose:LPS heptosyltransferase
MIMGIGDEIMASALAARRYAKHEVPVLICGANRRPRWSPVWENNPKIVRRPGGRFQYLISGPDSRPYVVSKTARTWAWRRWEIAPGEIHFTKAEEDFGLHHGGWIVIEPNIKGTNEGNKGWLWERWQEVADAFPGQVLQMIGAPSMRRLRGVKILHTPTFRHAAAVLAWARVFVGTEGGLHHAAAAVGAPAVVLFSEFISPEITGYPMHRNLYHAGKPCGSRFECAGCRASMEAITVGEVVHHLREILG